MDPIADMFSKIKNAQNAKHESLVVSFSKIKMAILEIMKNNHQIIDYREAKIKNSKNKDIKKIEVDLVKGNYTDVQRVSRPSHRIYATSGNIPRPKRPKSFIIVSTSEGVFEGEVARRKGLGGEIIAEIK